MSCSPAAPPRSQPTRWLRPVCDPAAGGGDGGGGAVAAGEDGGGGGGGGGGVREQGGGGSAAEGPKPALSDFAAIRNMDCPHRHWP